MFLTRQPVQPKTLSECPAHQQIQITHFHATPRKSFRGSSRCDRGNTFREIVKKFYFAEAGGSSYFELAFAEAKNAGRGSFAEGLAEGSAYVHLKYEGIKTKTHLVNSDGDTIFGSWDVVGWLGTVRCGARFQEIKF